VIESFLGFGTPHGSSIFLGNSTTSDLILVLEFHSLASRSFFWDSTFNLSREDSIMSLEWADESNHLYRVFTHVFILLA
jgi:hypothetical protein